MSSNTVAKLGRWCTCMAWLWSLRNGGMDCRIRGQPGLLETLFQRGGAGSPAHNSMYDPEIIGTAQIQVLGVPGDPAGVGSPRFCYRVGQQRSLAVVHVSHECLSEVPAPRPALRELMSPNPVVSSRKKGEADGTGHADPWLRSVEDFPWMPASGKV